MVHNCLSTRGYSMLVETVVFLARSQHRIGPVVAQDSCIALHMVREPLRENQECNVKKKALEKCDGHLAVDLVIW